MQAAGLSCPSDCMYTVPRRARIVCVPCASGRVRARMECAPYGSGIQTRNRTLMCAGKRKRTSFRKSFMLALPIFTAWASYRRAVRNSPGDCCRRMLPARIKKKDFLSEVLVLALPIFTARRQATIVGVSELNFCVRDGNRWTLTTINTNSHRMALHHPLY